MNRRAFFRRFGGLIAATAVAQGVVRSVMKSVPNFQYASEITEIAAREAARFEAEMLKVHLKFSPWTRLVRKSEFPANMGETIRGVVKES